jgi:uncharacterized membrane protein
VLSLTPDLKERLRRHHDAVLEQLASTYDVDRSDAEKQLSVGMRLVALLGAVALSAAVFSFFNRFWSAFSTPAQVAILVAAPIIALVAMDVLARREKTLYFTGILGVVAFTCFVVDLSVIGSVFNLTPTPNPLLAWAIFAAALAYAYGLRLLLIVGVVCFAAFFSTQPPHWSGCYWLDTLFRPENFFLPAALLLAVPAVFDHRRLRTFAEIYRVVGLLCVLLPVFVLASWGFTSYLGFPEGTVEVIYQIFGFCIAAAVTGIGVRKRWAETAYLGALFFVALLYARLVEWCWDWMPRWVFFLMLGAVAVVCMLLLKRLQRRYRRAAA